MSSTLKNILRFVALVLFQVLVINHVKIGGYVNPFVYPLFILLLPIGYSRAGLLFLAFLLGLCIDIFMGTPGLHAGATTLMAFCRPAIIKLVSGIPNNEPQKEPNFNTMGFDWWLRYSIVLLTIHGVSLFLLESFTIKLIWQTLLRTVISLPVSLFLITIILYLFSSNKKRN